MRGDAMSVDNGTTVVEYGPPDAARGWTTLVDGGAAAGTQPRAPSAGRVVGRFVVANLIAVVLLMAGSVWASGAAARDEAIDEAR
ncbi:MAG: putative signal transduction histidine kinase, partial [Marmoricola sp.]|nr:putative signal transduction histidine kinase [Marmoricola sp.]